jgi:hypothetical protein
MAFFMVSQFLMPYTLIILLSVGSGWIGEGIVSILTPLLTMQTARPVQLQVISGKSCRKVWNTFNNPPPSQPDAADVTRTHPGETACTAAGSAFGHSLGR